MSFPKNPTDKMLYEAEPDVVYQYNAADGSWTRLQGYGATVDLATPLRDGLMSSVDLKKLNALLIPPPRTSLTSEDCRFTFDSGTFGFRSSKQHLLIGTELSVFENTELGSKIEKKRLWKIHENTYGIDFRLNIPIFLGELINRGKLTYRMTMGPQGKQGEQGDQGINQLDTGPRGADGNDGANSPFPGVLSSESGNTLATSGNRGIVDIFTNEVSPNENYIIATRANIGNVDLCPQLVRPKKISSKWIVVTDERPVARRTLACDAPLTSKTCMIGPGCVPGSSSITNPSQALVQSFCSTRLYYVDMTPIEDALRAQFDIQLAELKAAKEQLATEWLKVMIQVYNEQKLSICCAIENCESKRENTRHRQYIETQRVQAAIAHVKVDVSGPDADTQWVDTEPGRNCPIGPLNKHITQSGSFGSEGSDGSNCAAKLIVDAKKNATTEAQALSATIPAGEYNVEVILCCAFTSTLLTEQEYLAGLDDINNIAPAKQTAFKALKPYTGVVNIVYQGPHGPITVASPNHGSFRTVDEARTAYLHTKFPINHLGGVVKAYFTGGTATTKALGNSGQIEVCFLHAAISLSLPKEMERGIGIPRDPGSFPDLCKNPVLEMDVNCANNTTNLLAVVADLLPGDYVAEITDCCCDALVTEGGVVQGISGTVAMQYNSVNGATILQNPDMGAFVDLNLALNAYLGNTFSFSHKGGEIRFWTTAQNPGGNGGIIRITIKLLQCVNRNAPIPVPPDFIPKFPSFQTCVMTLDEITFYEAGWKAKACCGAYVEAGGTRWLVVKRSIGTDITCGGGESPRADCIVQGQAFGFHPAIAYPTIDGRHFFGKPSPGSTQTFFRDNELEVKIINQIRGAGTPGMGGLIEVAGDPNSIDAILFPHEFN